MRKSRFIPILLLLLGGTLVATETKPVPLEYEQLELLDGRSLKKVRIKSYNPDSEKLLVFANGTALTFPLKLVPEPLLTQLRQAVPRVEKGSSVTPVPSARPKSSAAPNSERAPAENAPATEDDHQRLLAEHRATALGRAKHYYRYEYQVGSGAISVTALDFEADDPEPIQGWTGRYHTKGKAYLEFFDSKGRSFQRVTSEFEVITDKKPGHSVTVIDFSRTK